MIVLTIIFMTFIAGVLGTGLGGLIGICFKNNKKTVSLLLSFAGGIMLSIVCFDLISEALDLGKTNSNITIYLIIAGILLGYVVVFLLNHWIDQCTNHEVAHIDANHPKAHDDLDELIHADHFQAHQKEHSSYQLFMAGIIMASAIALHNLPEGIVIGASFAAETENLGLIMALIIGLHNIPEGMAVAVPLAAGGMHKAKAVAITALSGAPTIIGAVIGYYTGNIGDVALALSLSFASGAMLYVVFGELLPESILMWRSKLPAFAVMVGLLIGLLIIFIL